VPASTMRPSETTAIWSAWAMVDSRWAMMMVVRPERSRWRASVMRASLAASRLLVASSRISRAGSAIQARAKATSWRSPAASRAPRSPTWVSKPSGRPAMTWSAPTARAAASTSARVASGRPKRMLSRTVPENRNLFCGS
jgi:hypothetical protein